MDNCRLYWIVLTALVLLLANPVGGCSKLAPAELELMSLDITPPEVSAGDPVSVTAGVKNIGGSEGVYSATLAVDGVEVETKEVTVVPGGTETVSFSLVKDEAGTYQVAVGELSSSLVVKEKEPVLVAKEIELKYDDGTARHFISAQVPWLGGHIVGFSPPATPFTIKKVRIAGMLSSRALEAIEGKTFDVEIWDKDQRVLYSATYPYTKFTVAAWVEFEVPDIEVTDRFYAHIYTDSPWPGLHIGADDSVVNEHSDTTLRSAQGVASILARWPYMATLWFGDKSKVNWMIRVVGTVVVPEE